ncbi:hypothetical protein [Methylomagnum ishizawai]|uniref:hypothetical protein n=1 Tax=Methylomagnum ishizawai TaxID=1760988 RepID=UPI001C3360BC|nr:hypothetical protein [Methylomagnum ishizawai]BBL76828.1 hypothetical protein MishRS11D_39260 [Methylomagnum ishizawai]
MAGLFRNRPASASRRAENAARHDPKTVAAVLAMLAVYGYLFTHAATALGLPAPEDLADWLGWLPQGVFDADHNVDSKLWIYRADTDALDTDDQRLVLFGAVAGAFLGAYFLPLRHKRTALVLWFLLAGWVVYGGAALAGLLAAHGVVYLLFHACPPRFGLAIAAASGGLGYWALAGGDAGAAPALLAGWALMELYRHGLPRLERQPRALAAARTIAIQSALIVVLLGALAEGLSGHAWKLPLGILLFFWQWERLMLYHIDYNQRQVPQDLAFREYLAVFLTPAALPNWHWGVAIGQGYRYLDETYLAEDKNKLAWEGVKIWGVALLYLVFGEYLRLRLVAGFAAMGLDVHQAHTKQLVCDYVATHTATTLSVLFTTLLDQVRWFLVWAAVLHFKTGVWRVFGYRMDPYFDRPWLATNLVAFWTRFTFHYREFLVRAFFYPVFFRFFKAHTRLRIFVATMAAAGFGNLFWGHVPEEFFYKGLRFENFWGVLQTWPYFALLGLGIALTELYLLGKRSKRKPWTWDRRLPLDILAVYGTLQFYALIHVFARPCQGGTVADYGRLFLIGLGLSG